MFIRKAEYEELKKNSVDKTQKIINLEKELFNLKIQNEQLKRKILEAGLTSKSYIKIETKRFGYTFNETYFDIYCVYEKSDLQLEDILVTSCLNIPIVADIIKESKDYVDVKIDKEVYRLQKSTKTVVNITDLIMR